MVPYSRASALVAILLVAATPFASATSPGVDLYVRNLRTNGPVADGSSVNLTVDFGNMGNTTGNATFTIEYQLDGSTFLRQPWPTGIPGGWNGNTTVQTVVHGLGTHALRAVIDPDHNMSDDNASNNEVTGTFEVVNGTGNGTGNDTFADLVAMDLTTPSNATAGAIVPFNATIHNAGARGASGFTVGWYIDGNLTQSTPFPPGIPAAYYLRVNASLVFAPGTHTVTVFADTLDQLAESNESNNQLSTTFFVLPGADVRVKITDLSRVPLRTEAGDVRHPLARWQATIVVCNDGPHAAESVTTVMTIVPGNGSTTGVGAGQQIPARSEAQIADGACVAYTVRFDSPGVVGDFRLIVDTFARNDYTFANDHDSRAGFNLVGDEGGVAAPGGVRPA